MALDHQLIVVELSDCGGRGLEGLLRNILPDFKKPALLEDSAPVATLPLIPRNRIIGTLLYA